MKQGRSSCGAAVLNGKIYACGGWIETDKKGIPLKDVEMYDPKNKDNK